MKRLIKFLTTPLALAIAACVFTTALLPALAPRADASNQKTTTLRAAATNTYTAAGTATGSTIALAKRYNSVTDSSDTYGKEMIVFLNCTAASGALDVKMQGSPTAGGTFTDLTPASAWTQVTTAASHQTRTYLGPIPPYIRYMGTSAGSSCSYTYSMTAIVNE